MPQEEYQVETKIESLISTFSSKTAVGNGARIHCAVKLLQNEIIILQGGALQNISFAVTEGLN